MSRINVHTESDRNAGGAPSWGFSFWPRFHHYPPALRVSLGPWQFSVVLGERLP